MVNNNSFFSVVIPSYNRAQLVKKAIKSVLAQGFKDYELIIADDCSTDNTETVVKEMNHDKIRFHRNKVNKGNAGARNLGAKNAFGKYICYLDSDDQYHPDFLEKMHHLIVENDNPGFLWCNVNRITTNGEKLEYTNNTSWRPMEAEKPYLFFLKGLNFGTDFGFTVRRDCFETTGYFDERLRAAVDTDFILRIVQDFNFAHTSEILVDTFDHEGDRVRKDSCQKLNSYRILWNKHKQVILKHPELQKHWCHKLMWLNYHNDEKKEARKYLLKNLKLRKYKSLAVALIFELFSVNKAISYHRKISNSL